MEKGQASKGKTLPVWQGPIILLFSWGAISKLMATGSLFLGFESSGGIDYPIELIPHRNLFLLYRNF